MAVFALASLCVGSADSRATHLKSRQYRVQIWWSLSWKLNVPEQPSDPVGCTWEIEKATYDYHFKGFSDNRGSITNVRDDELQVTGRLWANQADEGATGDLVNIYRCPSGTEQTEYGPVTCVDNHPFNVTFGFSPVGGSYFPHSKAIVDDPTGNLTGSEFRKCGDGTPLLSPLKIPAKKNPRFPDGEWRRMPAQTMLKKATVWTASVNNHWSLDFTPLQGATGSEDWDWIETWIPFHPSRAQCEQAEREVQAQARADHVKLPPGSYLKGVQDCMNGTDMNSSWLNS